MEEVKRRMTEQCPDFYKEKIKAPKKKSFTKRLLKAISSVFKSK